MCHARQVGSTVLHLAFLTSDTGVLYLACALRALEHKEKHLFDSCMCSKSAEGTVSCLKQTKLHTEL